MIWLLLYLSMTMCSSPAAQKNAGDYYERIGDIKIKRSYSYPCVSDSGEWTYDTLQDPIYQIDSVFEIPWDTGYLDGKLSEPFSPSTPKREFVSYDESSLDRDGIGSTNHEKRGETSREKYLAFQVKCSDEDQKPIERDFYCDKDEETSNVKHLHEYQKPIESEFSYNKDKETLHAKYFYEYQKLIDSKVSYDEDEADQEVPKIPAELFDDRQHDGSSASNGKKGRGKGLARQGMKRKLMERKRCYHCETEKTPLWRYGPSGPNTLCNACGLRYKKMGKLIPEYRPAASPTFDCSKHSNFHRKIVARNGVAFNSEKI